MGAVVDTITGKSNRKAANAAGKAVDLYKNIDLPSISEMTLELEELVQQGQLTPEQAEAILIERSSMEDVGTDPALKEAQLGALAELQEIVDGEGLNAQAKARLSQIETEEANQERGQREAILQDARQRGVSGSGIELASLLANQQGSATRQSQRDLDVAALAEQQALEAILNQGDLSSQIRGQEFDEQARIAEAKDAIAQFNAQNRQNVELANTDSRNRAQEINLAEKQRIADQNVAQKNAQQQYNKELNQQYFDNEMSRASGEANAYTNQANVYQKQSDANQAFVGGLIETGGKVAAAGAGASDKNLKEDIRDVDASKLLDELTGYKYKYKNPEEHGKGDQVGVMAQDVEKVAPQAVEEHSDGKYIDYNKLGGPILAALADMNERVKKIEGDNNE